VRQRDGYLALEEIGLIGDGTTSALVGLDGSVAWLCLPRFDSEPLFCGLLDAATGGAFTVAPEEVIEARQRYEHDMHETAPPHIGWKTWRRPESIGKWKGRRARYRVKGRADGGPAPDVLVLCSGPSSFIAMRKEIKGARHDRVTGDPLSRRRHTDQRPAGVRADTEEKARCAGPLVRPGRLELPPRVSRTRPSTLRVYQFRHRRVER
jgi:Domain of unknown function (DUF5911)